MYRLIIFLFCFSSLSILLLAQEIETNKSNVSKPKVKKGNITQAVNDKITFKDGSTTLMEINSEISAGSIILPSIGGSILSGTKLYNYGGNLYWGSNQISLAGSAGGWTDGGTQVYTSTITDYVGIGTQNPHSPLSVGGDGAAYKTIYTANSDASGYAVYGQAFGSSGTAFYGKAEGTNAIGVVGYASGSGGEGIVGFAPLTGWAGWFTGNVNITGNLTVNSTVYTSDKRFKKNITPIKNTLNSLEKINVYSYKWNAEKYPKRNFDKEKLQYGVLAQELEKVYPNLVTTNKKGYKSVDYIKLSVLTLQAVKELKNQNDELRIQNSELEKRLSKIESLLGGEKFTKVSN